MQYHRTVEPVDSVLTFIAHDAAVYSLKLELAILQEVFENVQHSRHLKRK